MAATEHPYVSVERQRIHLAAADGSAGEAGESDGGKDEREEGHAHGGQQRRGCEGADLSEAERTGGKGDGHNPG